MYQPTDRTLEVKRGLLLLLLLLLLLPLVSSSSSSSSCAKRKRIFHREICSPGHEPLARMIDEHWEAHIFASLGRVEKLRANDDIGHKEYPKAMRTRRTYLEALVAQSGTVAQSKF